MLLTRYRPARPGQDPNQLHRIVAAATNGEPHLWHQRKDGTITVLHRQPLSNTDGDTLETRDYAPTFEPGARVRFQVRLNTVKNLPATDWDGARVRGKQVPVPADEIAGWATSMLSKRGLDAETLVVAATGQGCFQHRTGKMPQSWADVEGIATVTDPEAVAAAVVLGVGRNKRFGCGLLQVLPARN